MGKSTGKGKHIAKTGNHLYTCMISNPVVVRGGQYKCKISETHFNTHKKIKESKPNTKDSHQENQRVGENKREREEKRPTKTNTKQLRK